MLHFAPLLADTSAGSLPRFAALSFWLQDPLCTPMNLARASVRNRIAAASASAPCSAAGSVPCWHRVHRCLAVRLCHSPVEQERFSTGIGGVRSYRFSRISVPACSSSNIKVSSCPYICSKTELCRCSHGASRFLFPQRGWCVTVPTASAQLYLPTRGKVLCAAVTTRRRFATGGSSAAACFTYVRRNFHGFHRICCNSYRWFSVSHRSGWPVRRLGYNRGSGEALAADTAITAESGRPASERSDGGIFEKIRRIPQLARSDHNGATSSIQCCSTHSVADRRMLHAFLSRRESTGCINNFFSNTRYTYDRRRSSNGDIRSSKDCTTSTAEGSSFDCLSRYITGSLNDNSSDNNKSQTSSRTGRKCYTAYIVSSGTEIANVWEICFMGRKYNSDTRTNYTNSFVACAASRKNVIRATKHPLINMLSRAYDALRHFYRKQTHRSMHTWKEHPLIVTSSSLPSFSRFFSAWLPPPYKEQSSMQTRPQNDNEETALQAFARSRIAGKDAACPSVAVAHPFFAKSTNGSSALCAAAGAGAEFSSLGERGQKSAELQQYNVAISSNTKEAAEKISAAAFPPPPSPLLRRVVILDKVTRFEIELQRRMKQFKEQQAQQRQVLARKSQQQSERHLLPSQQKCKQPELQGTHREEQLNQPIQGQQYKAEKHLTTARGRAVAEKENDLGVDLSSVREEDGTAQEHAERNISKQLQHQYPQAYITHMEHERNVKELARQLQQEWGVHTTVLKARSLTVAAAAAADSCGINSVSLSGVSESRFVNNGSQTLPDQERTTDLYTRIQHSPWQPRSTRRAFIRKNAASAFPPDAVIAAGGDGTLLEAASFISALDDDGEERQQELQNEKTTPSGSNSTGGQHERSKSTTRKCNEGIWLFGFNTDPLRSEGRLCLSVKPPQFQPKADNIRTDRSSSNVSSSASISRNSFGNSGRDVTECLSAVLSPASASCFRIPAFRPQFWTPRRPPDVAVTVPPAATADNAGFPESLVQRRSGEMEVLNSTVPLQPQLAQEQLVDGQQQQKPQQAQQGKGSDLPTVDGRRNAEYVRAGLRYLIDGGATAVCRQRIRLEIEYSQALERQICERAEQQLREHAGLLPLMSLRRMETAYSCSVSTQLNNEEREEQRQSSQSQQHICEPRQSPEWRQQDHQQMRRTERVGVVRSVLGVSALNDVFVGECDSSRTFYGEVTVDGGPSRRHKSSGFLVATGTGSSAWSYNMSKIRLEQIKAVAEEIQRFSNMQLPSGATDWHAIRQNVNDQLLFHPSMPLVRYFVREPIENSIFSCEGCAGAARRVELTALSPDAMVAVDGLLSFPLPPGVKLIMYVSVYDALWTLK